MEEASELLDRSGEAMAAGRSRRFSGFLDRFVATLASLLGLYILLYVGDLFSYFRLELYGAHRALVYTITLILVFLLVPAGASAPRDRVPWYDVLLTLGGGASSFYMFLNWEQVTRFYGQPTPLILVLGGIMLLATLEAARRTVGTAVAILGAIFIAYVLFGNYFPGFLFTRGYSYARMIGHFYTSDGALFGLALEIFSVVVATYVIFGQFIQVSGAGDFFLKLGISLVGRYRGGPAKVAVVASSVFGTVSGSAVANVVVDGPITINMMKGLGYRASFAGGVEAAASNGGQIMPPVMGAAAFLMAEILGMRYWSVAVAAFLPAVLYYVALYFMLDFEAAKTGLRGMDRKDIPPFRETLKEGWFFLVPVVVLLVLIGHVGYNVAKSGLYSLLVLVAVSYFRKETRLDLQKIKSGLQQGALAFAELGAAAAVIGIIMAAVSLTGLGMTLSSGLIEASGGHLWLLLLLTAIASIIMGMGASTLLVYIVLAMFVAPAIVKMGVEPLAAHLFIFYFGCMSLVTPPVALAAYAAAVIARADYWKTGWEASRLGIVGYIVPFIFVYQPALLLKGSSGEVVLAAATAIIGTIALAGAMSGFFFGAVFWWQRILLGTGSLTLIYPGWKSDLLGLALVAIALAGTRLARALALPGVRPTD
ncbi:MAG: TRAP transporter fused permease subunit [Deltaproteobacteria bacterium]|nr:TRAP transporter fused permease subunit [Deltaproteobacteria bacterium]